MSIRRYAYDLAFANEAARLAFIPSVGDVGKVARQLDNNTYWALTSIGPTVWVDASTVGLTQYTTATRPEASAEWEGRVIYIRDAATPGEVQLCRQTATDGVYEWITVAY